MTFGDLRDFMASERYGEMLRWREERERLDQLLGVQGLDDALLSRYAEFAQLKLDRDNMRMQLEAYRRQEADLRQQSESLKKACADADTLLEFYKASLAALSDGYLAQLSDLLTDVYQSVYGTDRKSVRLSMEDYRGKKGIKLNIINSCNGKSYTEALSNDGGSAQILLGAMVAIYFIVKTGLPRVVFFDESFSALSDDTLDAFLRVLRRFSSELGFCFVVVEHAVRRLEGYVDAVYTIEDGVYRRMTPDEFYFSR